MMIRSHPEIFVDYVALEDKQPIVFLAKKVTVRAERIYQVIKALYKDDQEFKEKVDEMTDHDQMPSKTVYDFKAWFTELDIKTKRIIVRYYLNERAKKYKAYIIGEIDLDLSYGKLSKILQYYSELFYFDIDNIDTPVREFAIFNELTFDSYKEEN